MFKRFFDEIRNAIKNCDRKTVVVAAKKAKERGVNPIMAIELASWSTVYREGKTTRSNPS